MMQTGKLPIVTDRLQDVLAQKVRKSSGCFEQIPANLQDAFEKKETLDFCVRHLGQTIWLIKI